MLLSELDTGHLDQAFTALLRHDGVTAANAHRVLATLRSALNAAVREKLIADNPVRYLKLPPARRPHAVVWTPRRLKQRERTGQRPPVAVWTPAQALAALLREDVVLSMPPELTSITGRLDVTRFFATVPAGGRLGTIRLVRAAATGHLALAAYLPGHSARCHGYGIMVFTTTRAGIATITGFPSLDLFERFSLPPDCE